jgi:site-specific recombinase XerD
VPGSKAGYATRIKSPTTSRIRRNTPVAAKKAFLTPTALQPAAPAAPTNPPRPVGDLSTASIEEIAAVTVSQFSEISNGSTVGVGMRRLLRHLKQFDGTTWQQRWEASGLNDRGPTLADRLGGETYRGRGIVNAAVGQAFVMRLIQPTLLAFRSNHFTRYTLWFRHVAGDPLLDEYLARTEKISSISGKSNAKFDVCAALTVFGIDLADLTPEAFLHYAVESRKHGVVRGGSRKKNTGLFAGAFAWTVLYDMGHFPASAPRTLRAAVTKGQRRIEDVIDDYQLRNHGVRDLLIEYLRRRASTVDYSTLRGLMSNLGRLFWKTIEQINPDQADLQLSEEVFQQWKTAIAVTRTGAPRQDMDGPLLAIRSLYLDLQSWAHAEPERWARWVAPCPVRDEDLRWFHVRRRRVQERMAHRTRERQPLLPLLSRHVTDRWLRMRKLLGATRAVELGERFTLDGVTWQRASTDQDRKNDALSTKPVRAINCDTGELVAVSVEENQSFWQWAIIETLRLAGLRVEELSELTHLSVRNYQRPNGEVVALLVVSPSKSDRERVIPMSAELFHVIAQIIRRHRAASGTVPVCIRYDNHEKVWSAPMPFLFQTSHSGAPRGMSNAMALRAIHAAARNLAETNPDFAGVGFTPHDMRRLFATDLVNNGLPIHIGAALLGHLNIQTTRGYVAVFSDDIVTHYQQFLDRRRAARPQEEYRDPTSAEWADFQEHFDKRRVELGSCGRPYGTPCAHEHACIRCPMLSINPTMLPRLDELEEDLLARRHRAVAEEWLGEVEGIDLTLTFLRSKRDQTQRINQSGPVALGLPTIASKPGPL